MDPMNAYIDILVFAIAGAMFPVLNVGIGYLLRRDYPEPYKISSYESGMIPFGDARVKFHIHYYIFALAFVVFDVETVFMYPWAVVFRSINVAFAFWEMFIFILMLAVGLLYAWKKRVLTWI